MVCLRFWVDMRERETVTERKREVGNGERVVHVRKGGGGRHSQNSEMRPPKLLEGEKEGEGKAVKKTNGKPGPDR